MADFYLLNEDGTYLLNEDGTSKFILESVAVSAVKSLAMLGVG